MQTPVGDSVVGSGGTELFLRTDPHRLPVGEREHGHSCGALGGPAGAGDTYGSAGFFAPTDCSPYPEGQPLSTGDVVVRDVPPLPTSNQQCKSGGWRTYGVFKSQGDCVSFVATGGKNPPGSSL